MVNLNLLSKKVSPKSCRKVKNVLLYFPSQPTLKVEGENCPWKVFEFNPESGHFCLGFKWWYNGDLKSEYLQSGNIYNFFYLGTLCGVHLFGPLLWPIYFCLGFKWFLSKWPTFVWISNGWAFGFQISFKIGTICKPTSFWPLKISTSMPRYSLVCAYLFSLCNVRMMGPCI